MIQRMNPATPPRIRQPWLTVMRIAWIALAALQVGPVLWLLPDYFRRLLALDPATYLVTWSRADFTSAIAELGISPGAIAGFYLVTGLGTVATFWLIGMMLFWLRSDEWLGLITAYILIGIGVGFSGVDWELPNLPPLIEQINAILILTVWPVFFTFMYLFPDGRFVPRWSWILAVFIFVFFLVMLVVWDSDAPPPPVFFLLVGLIATGVGSQIYRYKWISTPGERQQTKLVLFGTTVWFCMELLSNLGELFYPPLFEPGPTAILAIMSVKLANMSGILISISIAVALIRYRLWDVDVVIRRTLIYAVVTALLTLVFFGGVAVLQGLFSALTAEKSELAIVVSTLAIAALFTPLRGRVQQFVDRAFYRRKYDAEQTLARFGAAVQNEVDIADVEAALLRAVNETLQPTAIALWVPEVDR